MVKMVSWNVNGIRAIIKKGFHQSVEQLNPDVICLQEVKAEEGQVEPSEGYRWYWHSAEKKGYSGTCIATKVAPLNVSRGLSSSDIDKEGRVITMEFPSYYLVNVYTPNSQRGLLRLDFRTKVWDTAFLLHLKNLEKTKPVIFCGDLNVAHKEIDIANPKSNVKNAGFTPEERQSFSNILNSGFLDSFRIFNKEPGWYSWWTYRHNAREKNIGWRLDYFCLSEKLRPMIKNAEIHKQFHGSDHCPVSIDIDVV
jgi:exodeoxyribonuclease-3